MFKDIRYMFEHFNILPVVIYICLNVLITLQTTASNSKSACFLPSVHNRREMSECYHSYASPPSRTFRADPPIWWCPLTENFDHYPDWIECPSTTSTYAGNDPGKQCHFPFVYKQKVHHTCLRTEGELHFARTSDLIPTDQGLSGYWWCSTTDDFDRDHKWTRCRPQLAQQLPCYFEHPTSVVGGPPVPDLDTECQAFAGHWICRTELKQLRHCPSLLSSPSVLSESTEGGNHPGYACHFPFEASLPILTNHGQWIGSNRRRNFTSCVPAISLVGLPDNSNSALFLSNQIYTPQIGLWCATTSYFDRDHRWTRCKPRQGPSLGHVWTQLSWINSLSSDELKRLDIPGRSFSREFTQAWQSLSVSRANWEAFQAKSESDEIRAEWWTWLAPFWWISFKTNQTLLPDHVLNEYTDDIRSDNPLSRVFNLPNWVGGWSSAGWQTFALTLNERWSDLRQRITKNWTYTWLEAFLVGFVSAFLCILICLCLRFLWLGRTKRRQLFHLLCSNCCAVQASKQRLVVPNNPSNELWCKLCHQCPENVYQDGDTDDNFKTGKISSPTWLCRSPECTNLTRFLNQHNSVCVPSSPCGCLARHHECSQDPAVIRLLSLLLAQKHTTSHRSIGFTTQFDWSAIDQSQQYRDDHVASQIDNIDQEPVIPVKPSAPPPSYDQVNGENE